MPFRLYSSGSGEGALKAGLQRRQSAASRDGGVSLLYAGMLYRRVHTRRACIRCACACAL